MGVHLLAKKVSESEYSIFGTMLMVTACVPIMPLQMVFAQQTAGTLATNRDTATRGNDPAGLAVDFHFVDNRSGGRLRVSKPHHGAVGTDERGDVVGDARGGADEFVDAAVLRRVARAAGFFLARLGDDCQRRRAGRRGRVDRAGVSRRRDGDDFRRVLRPRRVGGHRNLAVAGFVAGRNRNDSTDAACSSKSRR